MFTPRTASATAWCWLLSAVMTKGSASAFGFSSIDFPVSTLSFLRWLRRGRTETELNGCFRAHLLQAIARDQGRYILSLAKEIKLILISSCSFQRCRVFAMSVIFAINSANAAVSGASASGALKAGRSRLKSCFSFSTKLGLSKTRFGRTQPHTQLGRDRIGAIAQESCRNQNQRSPQGFLGGRAFRPFKKSKNQVEVVDAAIPFKSVTLPPGSEAFIREVFL